MPRPPSKKAIREAAVEGVVADLATMSMPELQEWMVEGSNPLCPIDPAYFFDSPAEVQLGMVPSEGDAPCDVMVVAEAPGHEEQRAGRLLVGPSGQRFEKLLAITQRPRNSIYMTNREKHRPMRGRANRPPTVEELRACDVILQREVELVRPEIIITLGAIAAHFFDPGIRLEKDHGRGRLLEDGTILIPWYHPAYTMRNGDYWPIAVTDARRLWEEVKRLRVLGVDSVEYTLGTEEEAAQLCWTTGRIGFDLETTSPQRRSSNRNVFAVDEAEIVGYSVSWADGKAMYVEGKPGGMMQMVLESSLIEKVCHNVFFEYSRLAAIGITMQNFHDTKIAAWMLQKPATHLKALARQELGRDPIDYSTVTAGRDMGEIEAEEIVDYAAADADNTRLLWPILEKELKAEGLYHLYQDVEIPLVPILAEAHQRGILVDKEEVVRVAADIAEEVTVHYFAANDALREAGAPAMLCDVGSMEKLAKALELLDAPIKQRTDAKKLFKTDEETLEGIREWHPELIDAVLSFRHYRKLAGYAQSYADLTDASGALHSQLVQAGHGEEGGDTSSNAPATGRLASRSPNLQNQPHKGRGGAYASLVAEWGQRLRRCLIARPGYVFVSADVGQEEPRIYTFITNDTEMQADFDAGLQPYGPIGEAIYQRPITKKDQHEWHIAKTYFLGRLYGSRPEKLLEEDPTLSREHVLRADAEITRRYPSLSRYYWQTLKEVKETGEVVDWFKRKRKMYKIYNGRKEEKEAAYREAANMKIQGPAASVMKVWMRRIWDGVRRLHLDAHLVMSIHDEVILEVREKDVDRTVDLLYTQIEGIMPINFPIDVKVGRSWAEMEEYNGARVPV